MRTSVDAVTDFALKSEASPWMLMVFWISNGLPAFSVLIQAHVCLRKRKLFGDDSDSYFRRYSVLLRGQPFNALCDLSSLISVKII
jgi:hypothetical protein